MRPAPPSTTVAWFVLGFTRQSPPYGSSSAKGRGFSVFAGIARFAVRDRCIGFASDLRSGWFGITATDSRSFLGPAGESLGPEVCCRSWQRASETPAAGMAGDDSLLRVLATVLRWPSPRPSLLEAPASWAWNRGHGP